MTAPDLVDRVRRRMANAPADFEDAVRSESDLLTDDVVLAELQRHVGAELLGAGPLEALLATPGVTDVLVNGPDEVWIDRGAGLERAAVSFADDAALRRLAVRLAASAGRRLDDSTPFADAALADGTRLHAALPPVVTHPTISLRVLARARYELLDLVRAGSMPNEVAELLQAVVSARLAFVVCGGTGTGKTTLLGALLGCVDTGERLLIVEDAAEIVTSHPHVVRLVTRAANVEGAGAIELRDLVRQSLRMRPDRIVVGEFRGAEIADLLAALNTGHAGGAATLHANSAADVPARFGALGALAGMDRACTHAQVASALQVIVQLRRGRARRRVVAEIGLLQSCGEELMTRPVWDASGPGAGASALAALIESRGVSCPTGWR
jgi:pilus assembly protein CpaF